MTPDRKRVYIAIAVAVVAVAVTAGGLNMQIARRRASAMSLGETAISTQAMVPGTSSSGALRSAVPAIEVSAERLALRLKEKGGSAEDWALLARSFVQMQRFREAVDAFARALETMPDNAAFLAERAEARKAAAERAAMR